MVVWIQVDHMSAMKVIDEISDKGGENAFI
jgi:hypothetical protein